jgi:hypothetical protein
MGFRARWRAGTGAGRGQLVGTIQWVLVGERYMLGVGSLRIYLFERGEFDQPREKWPNTPDGQVAAKSRILGLDPTTRTSTGAPPWAVPDKADMEGRGAAKNKHPVLTSIEVAGAAYAVSVAAKRLAEYEAERASEKKKRREALDREVMGDKSYQPDYCGWAPHAKHEYIGFDEFCRWCGKNSSGQDRSQPKD